MLVPKDGPGLRVLGSPKSPWYGGGYCGVCGGEPVPIQVRWWNPDDGWKVGVLCEGCAEECRDQGPKPDDYACHMKEEYLPREMAIDLLAEILGDDQDGISSMSEDLL